MYKQQIRSLKLIPAGGGCFEVTANGELLFSKLKEKRFPEDREILDQLVPRLNK